MQIHITRWRKIVYSTNCANHTHAYRSSYNLCARDYRLPLRGVLSGHKKDGIFARFMQFDLFNWCQHFVKLKMTKRMVNEIVKDKHNKSYRIVNIDCASVRRSSTNFPVYRSAVRRLANFGSNMTLTTMVHTVLNKTTITYSNPMETNLCTTQSAEFIV